jgi:hypothetical protein
MGGRLAALVLMGMLLAVSAHAQTPEPQEWSDVTEVVVRVKVAGPAMWKLTRGQSNVWVLGTLAETPENLTWDTTRLKRLLKGALCHCAGIFTRWQRRRQTLAQGFGTAVRHLSR